LSLQSELILGYKLSNKLDLGFSLEHYWFKRDGNLYDSKGGTYPHSSFADLNDETLKINGHHIEGGVGLLYHFGDQTYDYWVYDTPHFRRRKSHTHRESGLDGTKY